MTVKGFFQTALHCLQVFNLSDITLLLIRVAIGFAETLQNGLTTDLQMLALFFERPFSAEPYFVGEESEGMFNAERRKDQRFFFFFSSP